MTRWLTQVIEGSEAGQNKVTENGGGFSEAESMCQYEGKSHLVNIGR